MSTMFVIDDPWQDPTQEQQEKLLGYVTIKQAMKHSDVRYSDFWLRQLAARQKIIALKLGNEHRGLWLINLPSLLDYIKQMKALGSAKHDPR